MGFQCLFMRADIRFTSALSQKNQFSENLGNFLLSLVLKVTKKKLQNKNICVVVCAA